MIILAICTFINGLTIQNSFTRKAVKKVYDKVYDTVVLDRHMEKRYDEFHPLSEIPNIASQKKIPYAGVSSEVRMMKRRSVFNPSDIEDYSEATKLKHLVHNSNPRRSRSYLGVDTVTHKFGYSISEKQRRQQKPVLNTFI